METGYVKEGQKRREHRRQPSQDSEAVSIHVQAATALHLSNTTVNFSIPHTVSQASRWRHPRRLTHHRVLMKV